MDIKEAREKYILTTRFDFEDGEYIVLREPTMFELRELDSEDGKKNIEALQKIFPKAIVEHSFTDGDKPARIEQVAAMLVDSGTKFTNIVAAWMENINLNVKKSKNSEE